MIARAADAARQPNIRHLHADATIKFLRERAAAPAKPFYVYFAPPVPHDPRVANPKPAAWSPPPKPAPMK